MARLVSVLTFSALLSYPWTLPQAFAQDKKPLFDTSWFQNSRWNEGKAEVFRYKAMEKRYGTFRESSVTWIVVKENHVAGRFVKSENNASDSLPMLKFIQIMEVPTGIYTYHQELISFLNQKTLEVPRSTFSSQEWCGLTFKDLLLFPTKAVLEFNSYWENEGKGSRTYETKGPVATYNALPLLLRSSVDSRSKIGKLMIFEDLISNKVGSPSITEATINISNQEKGFHSIEVKHSKGTDNYLIQNSKTNAVTKWTKWDGSTYELQESKWIDYWNYNKIQDEALRFKATNPGTKK